MPEELLTKPFLLIVVQMGSKLGSWAVPDAVYGSVVFVSASTCIVAPVVLHFLFARIPHQSLH